MSEIQKQWYVLRAVNGKENKVKEMLDAEIKNTDLGDYVSEVLIPTEKVYTERSNGKMAVKERVMYSGYIFIKAALLGEVPHRLTNITNVIGFLGGKHGRNPEPLRQIEIDAMLGKIDESSTDISSEIPYNVGETVKVNHGPFSGFSGVIEEVNSEKKKLKVMVKIFGRKTPLELAYTQVEKE